MTVREDLPALLARLEAATGPDREIDCYIWGAIEGWHVHEVGDHIIVADKPGQVQMVLGWADPGKVARNVSINRTDIPSYTASIDTTLALVDRMLPGYDYILEHTNGGLTISCLLGTADPDARVFGATAPLAILIALLKSLTKDQP